MASVEVDPQTLEAIRRPAEREGLREDEIVAAAVGRHELLSMLERAWAARTDLDAETASELVYEELHELRRGRGESGDA